MVKKSGLAEDYLPPYCQEAIDRNALLIKHDIDRHILWEIIHNDDMKRPLSDEEVNKRFMRVGDVICDVCGERYEDHPNETRVLSYDGYPFLKRLCVGTLGKT